MTTLPYPSVPPLAPDQVHVWHLSLEADPSTLAAYWLLLSADERQRADRFVFPELRRRFVMARANLRQLLGIYTGRPAEELRFAYGPSGKPELSAGSWCFNVSHSGEQALIAVALGGDDRAVGVDLEMIRPLDYEAVGSRILAEADLLALAQLPASAKSEAFFRLWVRHEARAKAIGAGIGAHADVPAYDLDIGPQYRAAVATAIKDVRIDLFKQ